MASDLLLGGAAVATTAQQCTPVPEKGRYRLTTSGLRLTTSCSRWTKPGVCVRLTRMTVSKSAADVGLPQKRKSGVVNDDPVLAARDGRTIAWSFPKTGSVFSCREPTPASAYAVLRFPVLVLRGEHAPAPTRHIAEALPALTPCAHLAVVGGAGHLGPLTHEAEVSALIVSHIGGAEARADQP